MANRKYKGTAVQMLLALRLMSDNALTIIDKLIAIRAKWDSKYFQGVIATINTILKDDFGINPAIAVKEKTDQVLSMQARAKKLLQQVKTQVELDYRKDTAKGNRILEALGVGLFPAICDLSQSQLVEVLTVFQKNLTPELEAELVANGMNTAMFTELKGLAFGYYNLNAEQEALKSSKSDLTDELNIKLNDIYDELITVSKIASTMLESKADIDKLTYTTALKQVGYKETKKDEPSAK